MNDFEERWQRFEEDEDKRWRLYLITMMLFNIAVLVYAIKIGWAC